MLLSCSVFLFTMGGLVGWAALAAWALLSSLYLQGVLLCVCFWGAGLLVGKWAVEGVVDLGKERE